MRRFLSALVLATLALAAPWGLPGSASAGDDAGDADAEAITAAVHDYIDGWFTSDPERMTRALHPNLLKARVHALRGTDTEILDTITAETLAAYAGHNQERVAGKSLETVDILYRDDHYALVHAVSTDFYDLCGLVKIDGEWKVLQVLWDLNE